MNLPWPHSNITDVRLPDLNQDESDQIYISPFEIHIDFKRKPTDDERDTAIASAIMMMVSSPIEEVKFVDILYPPLVESWIDPPTQKEYHRLNFSFLIKSEGKWRGQEPIDEPFWKVKEIKT
jgi:hypothetical protein